MAQVKKGVKIGEGGIKRALGCSSEPSMDSNAAFIIDVEGCAWKDGGSLLRRTQFEYTCKGVLVEFSQLGTHPGDGIWVLEWWGRCQSNGQLRPEEKVRVVEQALIVSLPYKLKFQLFSSFNVIP